MPKLIFTQPEFNQAFMELPDGKYSVGRSRQNQIIIEDASVSGKHAELLVHGDEIIVRECGSRNGVFVGSLRIEAQSGVKHGQKIRFGHVELLLELGPPQYDDSTNISAVSSIGRIHSLAAAPSPTPPQFPIRFTPRKPVRDEKFPDASPNASPATVGHPAHHQNPEIPVSGKPLGIWVWLVFGAGALVLIVSWLFRS